MSLTAWIQFYLETKLNLVKKNIYKNIQLNPPNSLCFMNYISDENTIEAINQKITKRMNFVTRITIIMDVIAVSG